MAEGISISEEHSQILATKWWSAEETMRHGIFCREGSFTENEKIQVESAIIRYKVEQDIGDEDIMKIIFGDTKQSGFWASVTRAVPMRRIRSVYDHVQRVHHPLRIGGKWAVHEDAELLSFVNQHNSNWNKIGMAMQRTPESCRNRYQQYLMHARTERKGRWSDEEETRLTQVIQALTEEGKTSRTSQKFWREVSVRMNNTRSPKQCRGKWDVQCAFCPVLRCDFHDRKDSLYPRLINEGRRPHWDALDARILIHKVASLDLDSEADIPWVVLPDDGWKSWSGHRLQQKWFMMKRMVHTQGATHRDTVRCLLAIHGTLPVNNSLVHGVTSDAISHVNS